MIYLYFPNIWTAYVSFLEIKKKNDLQNDDKSNSNELKFSGSQRIPGKWVSTLKEIDSFNLLKVHYNPGTLI